jgi:hypothetical protein
MYGLYNPLLYRYRIILYVIKLDGGHATHIEMFSCEKVRAFVDCQYDVLFLFRECYCKGFVRIYEKIFVRANYKYFYFPFI